MDESLVGLMEIIGPVILLILLVWLAMRWGKSRPGSREDDLTARGTDAAYSDEERRRREGTDGL